jgi:hypothetical protein
MLPPTLRNTTDSTQNRALLIYPTCQHRHACEEAHGLQQPLEGAAAEDAPEVADVPAGGKERACTS